MKTIPIIFDEELLKEIEHIVSISHMSYSDIVNKVMKNWLKDKEIKTFEDEWIEKLRETPDDPEDAEKWIQYQVWSDL